MAIGTPPAYALDHLDPVRGDVPRLIIHLVSCSGADVSSRPGVVVS
jgi:hypothetical protein